MRQAAQTALSALYAVQPSARKSVESAAGYAAFSNFGMKILVAGSGTGKGIAVNNRTKATTYMKMAEIQAGLGFGVKKFHLVWVFENQKALDTFVNSGWQLGAQATASAKAGDTGSFVSRRCLGVTGSVAVSGDRRQPRPRADREGHQVLSRTKISTDRSSPNGSWIHRRAGAGRASAGGPP